MKHIIGNKMKLLKVFPVLVLAFALLSLSAFAVPRNGPYESNRHPADDTSWTYDGTRDALNTKLKQFFGREKNSLDDYCSGGGATGKCEFLADLVPAILGISGPEKKLLHGEHFYSGAEPHNATRRAAVITRGRGGKILGVAVLYERTDSLPPDQLLTIFVPARSILDPAMKATFTAWARGEIDSTNAILKNSPASTIINTLVVKTRSVGG